MSHRALMLFAVAVMAVAGAVILAGHGGALLSNASYTTTSQSTVIASGATTSDWVHVYAQGGDPGVSPNYAHQRNILTDPLVAGGQDAGLVIDWGSYPDLNKDFVFVRVLTLRTPTVFPNPAVSQITVTVTMTADPGGTQPLKQPDLRPIGLTARKQRTTTITLGPDQRAQLDMTVHTKKNPWEPGDLFQPHIILTVTYSGGPASFFVYDYTTTLHII